MSVIDVGDEDFEREVLERSETLPVVVDFWAPWCGPCRTLGPLLEAIAREHEGRLVLARVDVDQAPGVAARFGVRSIPTVVGIRDRAVRAEFVGAQREAVVRELVRAVLPGEADVLAAQGAERAAAGDAAGAEASFRAALEKEARHGRALLGLARVCAGRDGVDEALELLERILPHEAVASDAARLAAELRLRRGGDADPEALRAQVAARPRDPALRIALGRALAAAGRHEEAFEAFLAAVERDPAFDEEAARKAMLDLFELLGADHPLTERFRGELARVLFR